MNLRDIMLHRGIDYEEDVCTKCSGWGVKAYGQTCTWHGGVGGNVITSDVCDECWGSGNKNRKWTNLRVLKNILTQEQIKILMSKVKE